MKPFQRIVLSISVLAVACGMYPALPSEAGDADGGGINWAYQATLPGGFYFD